MNIFQQFSLGPVVAAFALLSASSAFANAAASEHLEEGVPGSSIHQTKPNGIAVTHEDLVLTCGSGGCTYEATYQVRNTTRTAQTMRGVFVGDLEQIDQRGKRIRIAPSRRYETAIMKKSSAVLAKLTTEACELDASSETSEFAVKLQPAQKTKLIFRGRLRPRYLWERAGDGPYAISYSAARNGISYYLLLRDAHSSDFCYHLWPLRSWRGTATIDIAATVPESWTAAVVETDDKRAEGEGENPRRWRTDSEKAVVFVASHGESGRDGWQILAPGVEFGYGTGIGREAYSRMGLSLGFLDHFQISGGMELSSQTRTYREISAGTPVLFLAFPSFFVAAGVADEDGASFQRWGAGVAWPFVSVQYVDDGSGGRSWLLGINF